MEIAIISKNTLRIRGKQAVIIVDPPQDYKLSSDAVLALQSRDMSAKKIENLRLTIQAPGEYEIAGIKITSFTKDNFLAYELYIDGISIFLTNAEALLKFRDKIKEYNMIILATNTVIQESEVTMLSPRVLVLYGEKALDFAKALSETPLCGQKYQTTIEKLPAELEIAVLSI